MKYLLVVSEYNMAGSGYTTIAKEICARIQAAGDYQVILLANAYYGQQHDQRYTIVPARNPQQQQTMLHNIINNSLADIAGVLFIFEIPMINQMVSELQDTLGARPNARSSQIPYYALFPLESPPVPSGWQIRLARLSERFTMTRFARDELRRNRLSATYLPLAIADGIEPRTLEQYEAARAALGIAPETFMIMSIADNQERKNLPAAFEIISKAAVEIKSRDRAGYAKDVESIRDVEYHLVTRQNSPVGYDLHDLAMRHGILSQYRPHERGLSDEQLAIMFQAADLFLLTSKAEGLAIPILEAMAHGTPVMAADIAAMAEHGGTDGERAMMIPDQMVITDPFGNGDRCFVSTDTGAAMLAQVIDMVRTGDVPGLERLAKMTEAASAYVKIRSWGKSVAIILDAVKKGETWQSVDDKKE